VCQDEFSVTHALAHTEAVFDALLEMWIADGPDVGEPPESTAADAQRWRERWSKAVQNDIESGTGFPFEPVL